MTQNTCLARQRGRRAGAQRVKVASQLALATAWVNRARLGGGAALCFFPTKGAFAYRKWGDAGEELTTPLLPLRTRVQPAVSYDTRERERATRVSQFERESERKGARSDEKHQTVSRAKVEISRTTRVSPKTKPARVCASQFPRKLCERERDERGRRSWRTLARTCPQRQYVRFLPSAIWQRWRVFRNNATHGANRWTSRSPKARDSSTTHSQNSTEI